jgi:hypothetical protein
LADHPLGGLSASLAVCWLNWLGGCFALVGIYILLRYSPFPTDLSLAASVYLLPSIPVFGGCAAVCDVSGVILANPSSPISPYA